MEMDERTKRELEELKQLRKHLQLQQEIPQKIAQAETAMARSDSRWEQSIIQKARTQALKEMPMEKPVKKATDNEAKVDQEINRRIRDQWSKKNDAHTRFYIFVKVVAVIVSVVILLGIHGYMCWLVYNQSYPEFAPAFTLHPNYYEDIATDQFSYMIFAVGQLIISLGINGVLCYALTKLGGSKKV